jgi:hypothetical protein
MGVGLNTQKTKRLVSKEILFTALAYLEIKHRMNNVSTIRITSIRAFYTDQNGHDSRGG